MRDGLRRGRIDAILPGVSNQPPVLGPDGVARPYIGGQALIEGVMMRSPQSFAARRDVSVFEPSRISSMQGG